MSTSKQRVCRLGGLTNLHIVGNCSQPGMQAADVSGSKGNAPLFPSEAGGTLVGRQAQKRKGREKQNKPNKQKSPLLARERPPPSSANGAGGGRRGFGRSPAFPPPSSSQAFWASLSWWQRLPWGGGARLPFLDERMFLEKIPEGCYKGAPCPTSNFYTWEIWSRTI